jgi:hypothetical protein
VADDTIIVTLRLAGASQFQRGAKDAGGSLKEIDDGARKAEKGTSKFSGAVGKAAPLMAGAAVAGGALAAKVGVDAVNAFQEANKVAAQTGAVIKSTGNAAHVSADGVAALAGKLSQQTGIDDEAIQSGQNMLLTFKNIRNETGKGNKIFDQASTSLVDLSTAMGTDPKQAAIQLGKALNDPAKGLTALGRSGIQFDKGQKDRIKGLVKQGKTMDAQKIILKELNSEFGGSAKAQATNTDRMRVAVGNLQESIGGKLAPMVEKATGWLLKFGQSGRATALLKSALAAVQPILAAATETFHALWDAVQPLVPYIQAGFLPALKILGTVLGAVLIVNLKVLTGAMKGLGVAIRGGIAGIKGLIAFGRRVAPSLVGGFNKVKAAAQSVWGFISGLPGKISGLAGRFVNAGKNIAGAIGRGIKSALQSGAGMAGDIGRAVADWLNAHTPLGDKISLPGPLPDFTLPALAAGGTITAPGSVLVGERGPEILSLPAGASVAPLGGSATTAHFYLDSRLIATAVATDTANRKARR